MEVIKTDIQDLLVIQPKIYGDERGWFVETYSIYQYREHGIPTNGSLMVNFAQDNMSFSHKGTLRGLHMQVPAQGKLVQVVQGEVFDVAVDLRIHSSTFGRWYGINLSGENKKQLWIPKGFAHGFYVLSDTAIFAYKCDEVYNSKKETTLLWNDPDIGIKWPLTEQPILSNKDMNGLPITKLFNKEVVDAAKEGNLS